LDVEDLRTFVEVADAGGVSSAARRLGVSKSIVSRRLFRLEEECRRQKEALQEYQKASVRCRLVLGEKHPETARAHDGAAACLHDKTINASRCARSAA
jgi:hypothetical protein